MSDTIDTLVQVVSDLTAQNKSLYNEVQFLRAEIAKIGAAEFLQNLKHRTKEEAKVCCINWIKEYRSLLADITLKEAKGAVENRLKELNIYPF